MVESGRNMEMKTQVPPTGNAPGSWTEVLPSLKQKRRTPFCSSARKEKKPSQRPDGHGI